MTCWQDCRWRWYRCCRWASPSPLVTVVISAIIAGLIFLFLCGAYVTISGPAAMRMAVPEANPALFIGASLGVTFTFNLSGSNSPPLGAGLFIQN